MPSKIAREKSDGYEEIYIDEYQDSNYIQDAILRSVSKESEGGHNMFMVGDVKQSIYSFRLARPELFLEKYHGYQQKGEEYQLIELRNNFRSRSEVLTFVNDVFYQIMHEDLGNIEYTQNVALVPTMEFEQGCDAQTELLLLESNEVKDSEEDAVVLEARMIATRIHEMIDGEDPMMVTGKDEEGNMILRKAKYSDIVILLRSMKTNAEVIQKELMNAGIPAFANNQKGYFDTVEIRTLLSLLSVVDNIYMDIDLAAVLRSPMIGMSEEELGRLKVDGEKDSLYECLCETKDKMEKSKKALELLDLLRDAKTYLPLTQLIWLALEKSGYYHYAGAMPQGKKRQGNILMLVEHAKAFESSQIKGLFHFVRFIEQCREYDMDYGEANTMSEDQDLVRISSIHKSKGLEYPIVFVSKIHQKFNLRDGNGSMIFHGDYFIGADHVDPVYRTRKKTILKNLIKNQMTRESLGEELRVLYVAMTRAKEKLILTGTVKKIEDYQAVQAEAQDWQEEKLPYGMREGARCYWDWIFPALAGANEEFPVQILEMEHLITDQVTEREDRVRQRAAYETWDPQEVFDATIRKDLEEKFSYVYPYGYLQEIPAKVSVSELKKQGREEPEEETVYLYAEKEQEPIIPDFMKESRETLLQGAARGTAYHRILECLDYSKADSQQEIEQQIEELLQEEKISKEAAKVVRSSQISWFVRSAVGKRMKEAFVLGTLHREQQFVMSIDASERNPAWNQGEQILVQGIIDAFWEEADGLVLVDYKTDHVKEGQELIDRYQRQMHYYSQALERAYGKKVKECYLYSFALGKAVAVEV